MRSATSILSAAIACLGIGLALAGCEPSEFRPVPLPAGGGGAAPQQPSYARPVSEPVVPPYNPMLQDPEENIEDASITVYADSDALALKQCETEAQNRSDEETLVTCLGCIKMTQKSGRYACTIRIETRPVYEQN